MTQMIRPRRPWLKEFYVRCLFFVFGRALQTLSRTDPILKSELARWPEDFLVLYRILPDGPRLVLLRNREGRLEYRGSKAREEDAGLVITLKNLESAFLVMSLQVGTTQAYAENRVGAKGNIDVAMSLIKCLSVLITYLAPRAAAEKVLKRLPEIPWQRKFLNRFRILFLGVPFGG